MNKKVLIVGYGSSGQRYHSIIKKKFPKNDVRILSITNGGNIFNIDKKKIKIFNPDIVFFCNPATKRIDYLNLIKKTKKVFFEKPFANNLNNGKKILSCIDKKKSTLVGYNLRYYNILIFVKKNLKKYLGKIYSFNCESGYTLKNWRKKNYKNSVSASKQLGGGAFLELSHELDYISWLFGKKFKCKAYSLNTNQLKINVEDNVKIIFQFPNKILGNLSLDFLSNQKKRFIDINGTKGSLYVDLSNNQVKYLPKGKSKSKKIYFKKNNINDTYSEIVDRIFKKKLDLSSVKNSLFVLKILDNLKSNN